MTKKDIKTLDDAKAFIKQVEDERDAVKVELKSLQTESATKIKELTTERDNALAGKKDAEEAANDAINKANDAIATAKDAEASTPKKYIATVKGIGKVQVNFGVDGIEKADLVKDTEKLAELVKKGSGAVTVVEPSKEK